MSKVLRKFKPQGATRPIYDLRGETFGNQTVIELVSPSPVKWLCRCECGKESIKTVSEITRKRHGKTNSCGCVRSKALVDMNTSHGYAKRGHKERLYSIWLGMRNRCNNPNYTGYKWYGGRGISVCEEWNDYKSFRSWALSNGYDDSLEIDRINNDSGYSPLNCRWVSHAVNMKNTRRAYV